MMLAATIETEGRRRLVIGLYQENMSRLANDEPIMKPLDEIIPDLAGWDLVILGPEDVERFVARYGIQT